VTISTIIIICAVILLYIPARGDILWRTLPRKERKE